MVNLFRSNFMQNNEMAGSKCFNRSYCIYLMNTLLGDVYVPRGILLLYLKIMAKSGNFGKSL